MVPRQKRSIQIYFLGMSVAIILILVVYNSIALQHSYRNYSQAKKSEAYMDICHSVFQVIRHYGFERNHVTVALNSHGSAAEGDDPLNSVRTQSQQGDNAYKGLLEKIETLPQNTPPINLSELKTAHGPIDLLRETYRIQLSKPVDQRDQDFADLWFNAMSRLLRQLHYLLFNIANSGPLLAEQMQLANMYYLLAQLVEYAEPIVAYLQGAFYNSESLSTARIVEIRFRHEQLGYSLNKLLLAAQSTLDQKSIDLVKEFQLSFFDTFFTKATRYIDDMEKMHHSPYQISSLLSDGVLELEKLNTVSENLVDFYTRANRKAISEQGKVFFLGIMTAIMSIGLIIFSLFLGYQSIDKRILANTKLFAKLITGELGSQSPKTQSVAEMNQLQHGIQHIKENLINLDTVNKTLLEQVDKSRQSEQQLHALSDTRGLLLKELHHRFKNNLQIISSMISLQIRRHADEKVSLALREAQRRVNNIAIAHQLLYESDNLAYIKSKHFFDAIITSMANIYDDTGRVQIRRELDDFSISFETAKTLSLILSEALANSYKHAFPGNRTGQVVVFLTKHHEHILVRLKDDGIGFDASAEQGCSLGVTLIRTFVKTLQGDVSFRHNGGTEILINVKDV